MSSINDLNNQMKFLITDFENSNLLHESKQIINKQIEDINENNKRLLERRYDMSIFNTLQQTHQQLAQPQQPQYLQRNNNNINNINNQQLAQQQQPQYLQRNNNNNINNINNNNNQQLAQPQLAQYLQRNNNLQEINTNEEVKDLRLQMNNQMDILRFDNKVHLNSGLVPVDMEHIYSGNLFQDGTPIPHDIQNNFPTQAKQIKQYSGNQSYNGRILLQQKSKTSYRNDFNNRMEKLSPFNQQLFTSFQRQPLQTTSEGGIVLRENPTSSYNLTDSRFDIKNSIREDMNNKISQFRPLSSIKPLPNNLKEVEQDNYIPNPNTEGNKNNIQVQKLRYQEMMPVMSNY